MLCNPSSTSTHSESRADLQIKYFRIADSVLDQAAEEQKQLQMQRQRQGNRGGFDQAFPWSAADRQVGAEETWALEVSLSP